MLWQLHLATSDTTIYPLALVWVGFVAGLFGALLGLGGGWLIVPALIAMGMPAVYAVGTSLVAMIVPTFISVVKHHRKGRLDWRMALHFALPQLVAVELGRRLLLALNAAGSAEVLLRFVYLGLLGFLGVAILRTPKPVADPGDAPPPVMPWGPSFTIKGGLRVYWLGVLLAATGAGLMSGLLGIGGGLLLVPAITAICRLPVIQAVAASLFVVLLGSGYGAASFAIRGDAELIAAATVIVGAIVGSLLGSHYANHAPERTLKRLFATLAFCTGASVALQLIDLDTVSKWLLFGAASALGITVLVLVLRVARPAIK
jgi:uncharacterized membrane protein YfcA